MRKTVPLSGGWETWVFLTKYSNPANFIHFKIRILKHKVSLTAQSFICQLVNFLFSLAFKIDFHQLS